VLAITIFKAGGQALPDVFLKNSLKEQMNFLDEHTKIYDNYRAIREDMFQKIKGNVSDTLSSVESKITGLNKTRYSLNLTIDSLKKNLELTKTNLDEMTRTKNSIRIIGMQVNKSAYNNVMWIIVGGLVAVLVIGFLIFKRNLSAIFNTKKEYDDLKNEFDAYRKTSREAREKMTMDHFNEIKRLKSGG
jgi:predicted  nucleic acid-binding Zn-ribbon protein